MKLWWSECMPWSKVFIVSTKLAPHFYLLKNSMLHFADCDFFTSTSLFKKPRLNWYAKSVLPTNRVYGLCLGDSIKIKKIRKFQTFGGSRCSGHQKTLLNSKRHLITTITLFQSAVEPRYCDCWVWNFC